MSYGSEQGAAYGSGRKRKPYWSMIQGQADAGMATRGVMETMQNAQNERARQESNAMWQKDYDLGVQQADMAKQGAKAAAGGQMAQLGLGIMGKYGSGSGKFGSNIGGDKSWGGSLGGALGGAGIGHGLATIFGGGHKARNWGTALGGLAGWFLG